MRTTVDLPEDLHDLARELAHQSNRSMSEVVTDLIRLGLSQRERRPTTTVGGLPQISVGRPVTAEDVRAMDDEG